MLFHDACHSIDSPRAAPNFHLPITLMGQKRTMFPATPGAEDMLQIRRVPEAYTGKLLISCLRKMVRESR
jgi:hypothetical protein